MPADEEIEDKWETTSEEGPEPEAMPAAVTLPRENGLPSVVVPIGAMGETSLDSL